MEAENNSPVADTSGFEHIVQQFQQDISKDAYFEEESMRIKQAFSNTKQGEDQLLYLRHQLQCVKTFCFVVLPATCNVKKEKAFGVRIIGLVPNLWNALLFYLNPAV